MEFIEEQKFLFVDLSSQYDKLGDLFTKKLWHQLSEELHTFLSNKSNQRGENFYNLYDGFISKFETRLSQLTVAELVSLIGYSFNDPERAVNFFTRVLESRKRLGPEASLYLDSDIIIMKLHLGLVDQCQNLLDDAKTNLNAIGTNEPVVFSKFYKAELEFRKICGPANEFYNISLLYLSYTPVEEMLFDEKYMLATDMALAAVCGDNLFNFGEIVTTPILSCLKDTPNQWLYELVLCMNDGDINIFNNVINTHKDLYYTHPALVNCHQKIQQKIVLLALLNMIFKRPSFDRCVSYQDIAKVAQIPLEQVDWVLMRSMSLGLIKGTIDEVEQNVNVTWIQPRVLDRHHIEMLCAQIDDWSARVKNTLISVEDQALELYVS